jgi:YgiT-type zinc finger domain-containing protein
MEHPHTAKPLMPCALKGCSGHYEPRLVVHTAHRQGRLVVIEQVPAEVCDLCGDTLYTLETSERISTMLEAIEAGTLHPQRSAPVLPFAA